MALLACGCDTLPPSNAFTPWPAPCRGGPQQSGQWGECAGAAGRHTVPASQGIDGRGPRTALRLSPGRGVEAGRVAGPSLNSIAMPLDGQGFGLATTPSAPVAGADGSKTEDDYGTLFRGTETLFRFCARSTKEEGIVSAGRFKEGG
jgi:hypothetical protein